MKQPTVVERRKSVEMLFFMHDADPSTIAEILQIQEATVRDDIQHVSDMLRERAGRCSEDAGVAFEEVAGLLYVARQAQSEASRARKDKDKAALYNTSARAFFLAGRLKQGRPE